MKTLITIIIVLIVVIAGYRIISSRGTMATSTLTPLASTTINYGTTSGATSSGTSSASSTTSIATKTVTIHNMSYNPANLTVKVDTKVTWTNNDSITHTVTSNTGTALNSGNIASGNSYSHTFTQVGTYPYHCSIHPSMKGTVTVTQ